MTKKYAPKVYCCVQHMDIKDFCKKEAGCSGEGERFNTRKCPSHVRVWKPWHVCVPVRVRAPCSAAVWTRASIFKGWIWAPQLSPAEPVRCREKSLPSPGPLPLVLWGQDHTRQEQLDEVSCPPPRHVCFRCAQRFISCNFTGWTIHLSECK